MGIPSQSISLTALRWAATAEMSPGKTGDISVMVRHLGGISEGNRALEMQIDG